MAKSVVVTYILWLVGGWSGLHLFYLGRDRHAFTWWCSAGGFFGIGCLRDLVRIPEYVEDANDAHSYTEFLKARIKRGNPSFSITRFIGEVMVGWMFGHLLRAAIPEDIIENQLRSLDLFVPFAIATGIHLVANIGHETGSFKFACLGTILTLPLYWHNPDHITYGALASAILLNWKGKGWRHQKQKRSFVKRAAILVTCAVIYGSLWTSVLIHNTYVTTSDGERVRVKDAVTNFFNSPAWSHTKDTLWQLYSYIQEKGWEEAWKEFIVSIDPEGETHAYKVLGVASDATDKVITTAYKKLVKKWHPDKQPEHLKKDAEQKFIEIQQAYETLSTIKQRRQQRNKSSRGAERDGTF